VALNGQRIIQSSMEQGMKITRQGQVFSFVRKRIISAVRRVKFVSDRTSYTILRGR
jgi:hypothetical protein